MGIFETNNDVVLESGFDVSFEAFALVPLILYAGKTKIHVDVNRNIE